jgi:hypothetical protein
MTTHCWARLQARVITTTLLTTPLLASLASLATACGASRDESRTLAPASPAVTGEKASNAVILQWNTVLHEAALAHDGHTHGLAHVRVLAMLHLAQHDAVNAVAPAYESYAFRGRDSLADPVAAAASAAHAVLVASYPKQAAMFDARLEEALKECAEPARTRGVELGQQAALAILERREQDGSHTPDIGDYVPRTGPGAYQFVPPFDLAFAPGWRAVEPFALQAPSQFRPDPPPALTSTEYTVAFDEVKTTGGQGSSARDPEHAAYAKYWWEYSEIGWNRIARTVADERELDLASAARLLALVNMALSDAYVAGWDAKFHYDFWRPYTAIRAADSDGNPATAADATWVSAEVTPPVQDYPSTHSALGDAAAEVLASVIGDGTPFTVGSTTAPAEMPTRSFESFTAAADENADSRVRGGLHFRFSCEEGQRLGRRIGLFAVETRLRPL